MGRRLRAAPGHQKQVSKMRTTIDISLGETQATNNRMRSNTNGYDAMARNEVKPALPVPPIELRLDKSLPPFAALGHREVSCAAP